MQSLLHTVPLRRRRLVLAIPLLLLLIYLCLPYSATTSTSQHASAYAGLAIVSLASALARLDDELPVTIWSLLRQSAAPKEIRLYLPESEKDVVEERMRDGRVHQVLMDGRVNIQFVEDQGPGTKFLPVLTELLALASHAGGEHNLDQPLVIVDDDHAYSPRLIETLLSEHERLSDTGLREAVVGLRGWRVRKDLQWGVPIENISTHVIEGWRLRNEYRVGVLTANEGYMVFPRFFIPSDLISPAASHPPARSYTLDAPILDYASAPLAASLVDDIWMNGHLSSLAHPRYVAPLAPPSAPSVDITLPNSHPLERKLEAHGTSRATANDETLAFFREAWMREGLWYDLDGDGKNVDGQAEESVPWAGWISLGWSWVVRWLFLREVRGEWGVWVGNS